MATEPPMAAIRCVVFDMDGTLTVSPLDFDLIRAECGVPQGHPILEYIEQMPQTQRRKAEAVLIRHERRAARESAMRDGAGEVLDELRQRGFKTALLTRNSAESVRTMLRRFGLQFDCWLSREEAQPKPSPDPLLRIARTLGLSPGEMLMVGDYVYDVLSGHAAGARTAFVRTDNGVEPPEETDVAIDELHELLELLPKPLL